MALQDALVKEALVLHWYFHCWVFFFLYKN